MAEALDLNIPLGEGGAESVEKIIKPLLELEKEKAKEGSDNPFSIENYYPDDTLGSDVLKNKYLAQMKSTHIRCGKDKLKLWQVLRKQKPIKKNGSQNFTPF